MIETHGNWFGGCGNRKTGKQKQRKCQGTNHAVTISKHKLLLSMARLLFRFRIAVKCRHI